MEETLERLQYEVQEVREDKAAMAVRLEENRQRAGEALAQVDELNARCAELTIELTAIRKIAASKV